LCVNLRAGAGPAGSALADVVQISGRG